MTVHGASVSDSTFVRLILVNYSSSEKTAPAADDGLPVAGLSALAMTGFICIVTETLPAGLLPQISAGLGVSPSTAGQMVTAYALGSLVAVMPLAIATRGWRRRRVLLLTILGFLVFNSITAIASNYAVTLIARFFAGVAAGLAWSLLAGYARRMVIPSRQGKALAVAMAGTPIALSLGVPLGTFMGAAIGWRSTFWAMSGLALLLIVWVLAKVPDYPGQAAHERWSLKKVFTTPGVRPVLSVVMLWMLAHNILYTYIAPFVTPSGIGDRIDSVLLIFGVAALAGIWVTAKLVDRYLRLAVLSSLAVFTLIALVFGMAAQTPALIYAGVFIWGATFGGAATLLQTALADSAGNGADIALSMNVVTWNTAIAGGGIVGGILLDVWGVRSYPWVLTCLLAGAWLVAWSARTHAFRSGRRYLGG